MLSLLFLTMGLAQAAEIQSIFISQNGNGIFRFTQSNGKLSGTAQMSGISGYVPDRTIKGYYKNNHLYFELQLGSGSGLGYSNPITCDGTINKDVLVLTCNDTKGKFQSTLYRTTQEKLNSQGQRSLKESNNIVTAMKYLPYARKARDSWNLIKDFSIYFSVKNENSVDYLTELDYTIIFYTNTLYAYNLITKKKYPYKYVKQYLDCSPYSTFYGIPKAILRSDWYSENTGYNIDSAFKSSIQEVEQRKDFLNANYEEYKKLYYSIPEKYRFTYQADSRDEGPKIFLVNPGSKDSVALYQAKLNELPRQIARLKSKYNEYQPKFISLKNNLAELSEKDIYQFARARAEMAGEIIPEDAQYDDIRSNEFVQDDTCKKRNDVKLYGDTSQQDAIPILLITRKVVVEL